MIIGLVLVIVAAGLVAVLDLRPGRTNIGTAIVLSSALTIAVIGAVFMGYAVAATL